MAREGAAFSGDHDPRRRRHAAALGPLRCQQGDYDRRDRRDIRGRARAKEREVAMARPVLPEMSPWKRQPLTIPPDSWRDWTRLVLWELWMGLLLGGALIFAIQLITAAPD